mgnify:CR=1 FL=1
MSDPIGTGGSIGPGDVIGPNGARVWECTVQYATKKGFTEKFHVRAVSEAGAIALAQEARLGIVTVEVA